MNSLWKKKKLFVNIICKKNNNKIKIIDHENYSTKERKKNLEKHEWHEKKHHHNKTSIISLSFISMFKQILLANN